MQSSTATPRERAKLFSFTVVPPVLSFLKLLLTLKSDVSRTIPSLMLNFSSRLRLVAGCRMIGTVNYYRHRVMSIRGGTGVSPELAKETCGRKRHLATFAPVLHPIHGDIT